MNLSDYQSPTYESSCFKGIPIIYRYHPKIRKIMKSRLFSVKYRGKSKSGYDYYFTYEKANDTFYYQEEFNAPNKYEFSKFSTGSNNLVTTAAKLWIKLKEDNVI